MTSLSDTTPEMQSAFDARLQSMSHAERLERAFALSKFARELVWAGAERAVGHLGREAVIRRFFAQMYGAEFIVPDALIRGA